MRMPSLREEIPQNIVEEGRYPLIEWADNIRTLLDMYGPDKVLYSECTTDVTMLVQVNIVETEVLAHNITYNPELTLKQWKESINHMIDKYGEDAELYTASKSTVKFYLSEIDRS
jgi:hypothetical protein